MRTERGWPERLPLLGVGVNMMSMNEAVAAVERLIAEGGSHYVCLCNAFTLMTAQDDPAFSRAANEADLVLPDGMPLVWAARLLGRDQRERISVRTPASAGSFERISNARKKAMSARQIPIPSPK